MEVVSTFYKETYAWNIWAIVAYLQLTLTELKAFPSHIQSVFPS